MSNPNFNPMYSTNHIYMDLDQNKCLTDELDQMKSDIEAIPQVDPTQYAPANHNHDGSYASSTHNHNYSEIQDAPKIPDSLPANGGNADTVGGKHASDFAPVSHVHSSDDIAEGTTHKFATADEKAKLAGIEEGANNYTHPATHPATMITEDAAHRFVSDTEKAEWSGKADLVNGVVPLSQIPSEVKEIRIAANIAARNAMTGLFAGLNVYVTDATGDSTVTSGGAYYLYDGKDWIKTGESESMDMVLKWANIQGKPNLVNAFNGRTGAVEPASGDYSADMISETDERKVMTSTERKKLAGIAQGANNYTHPSTHPASMITGLPTSLPANGGNADTLGNKKPSEFAAVQHTHKVGDVIDLLDLILTKENGDVKQSLSGKDVLATIQGAPIGVMTYYAPANTKNSPNAVESWRFISHKTGPNYGWVLGFSNKGSVASNYIDNGTWRGWKSIYDAVGAPLWKGNAYMNSPNSQPQTVTPSKKLSECRNGWLLLWSDYDPGKGSNDADFVTTMIPKKNPTGGNWGGKAFYCDIPRFIGTASDVNTERRIIKSIYIHDDCIKGSFNNSQDERNDVVLRAVYEF